MSRAPVFVLAALLSTAMAGQAGPESLEHLTRELAAEKEFLTTYLSKARRLALRKAQGGEYQAAWDMPRAVSEAYPDEPFVFYYPFEEVFLAYLSGRWDILLDTARLGRQFSSYLMNRATPATDNLAAGLHKLFVERHMDIATFLHVAALASYQRDFLLLKQRALLRGADPPGEPLPELNDLADAWLENHREEPYAAIVRQQYRHVMKPKPYGFGGGFSTGWFLPQGGLGSTVSHGFLNFGFNLEVLLWRLTLGGMIVGDFGPTLERDLDYAGYAWKKGDDLSHVYVELRFGADVLATDAWSLAPFVSWGALEIGNDRVEKLIDDEKKDEDRATEEAWGFGVQIRRFWGEHGKGSGLYLGSALGIRFPRMERSLPGTSGRELYLELQAGIRGRGMKREP